MARLAPMIIPALLVVVLCCPGCGRANLAPYQERLPADKQPTSHGPQTDTGDFPGDPYGAYPGMGFGPMGPVVRSADDATLPRSLSSASGDDVEQRLPKESQLASARSGDDETAASTGEQPSPKPEYRIVSVEFTRVETPFLIGIWIFFASIAKIGKWPIRNLFFPLLSPFPREMLLRSGEDTCRREMLASLEHIASCKQQTFQCLRTNSL